jgi:SAM-dependent methyltransferase
LNHPAISDPSAMLDYPHARDAERDALLDSVKLRPGMRVADIQAAGGYLSDGVYERLGGRVECLCIEPVAALNSRLNPAFTRIEAPIDRLDGIPNGSADVALGLAGLHHSPSKAGTVAESFRILKPGGELAICDVIVGSAVAGWLNEYVDHHNPDGHSGDFLYHGELTALMARAGFVDLGEQVRQVPWVFPSKHDMARFFKGLFGLTPAVEEVGAAARRYLPCRQFPDRYQVDWELIYGYGRKPG